MNKLYKAHLTFVVFLVMAAALPGCRPDDPGIWKNGQIPQDKRDDFHDRNNNLFKAILSGHQKEVELLLSADLLNGNNNSVVDQINYQLKNNNYHLLDEYYVIHKHDGAQNIKAGFGGKYEVNYVSVGPEAYVAFFVPKKGRDQWMITVIYGKYSYGWRVSSLDIDRYTVNGKNASELFKQAKNLYTKGYLADAVNTMALADKCLHPSPSWLYANETEINNFYAKVIDDANILYKFPVVVKQVPSQPSIFRITDQNIPEGDFPAVYYLSKINLKDTAAIKQENTAIKQVIGKIFRGINKNKKYILYSAFNEMPQASRYVASVDITDTLKNN